MRCTLSKDGRLIGLGQVGLGTSDLGSVLGRWDADSGNLAQDGRDEQYGLSRGRWRGIMSSNSLLPCFFVSLSWNHSLATPHTL